MQIANYPLKERKAKMHTEVKAFGGKSVAGWRLKLDLLAVWRGERVGERVEVHAAAEHESGHDLRGGDERVRRRVRVVASGEIAVERGHDRVLVALLDVLPVQ